MTTTKEFRVTFTGFKNKEAAMNFMEWYEGGGEQAFYDYLQAVGGKVSDGCNVDVQYRSKTGNYYDETSTGYEVRVK